MENQKITNREGESLCPIFKVEIENSNSSTVYEPCPEKAAVWYMGALAGQKLSHSKNNVTLSSRASGGAWQIIDQRF